MKNQYLVNTVILVMPIITFIGAHFLFYKKLMHKFLKMDKLTEKNEIFKEFQSYQKMKIIHIFITSSISNTQLFIIMLTGYPQNIFVTVGIVYMTIMSSALFYYTLGMEMSVCEKYYKTLYNIEGGA